MDATPPTHHALIQHTKRALLVAPFIWSKSLTKEPEPADWGWEWYSRTKRWMPHWADLPDVSEAWSLLVGCGALLPARAIVSATMLDFTVANCASVREAAQTMTVKSKQQFQELCMYVYVMLLFISNEHL